MAATLLAETLAPNHPEAASLIRGLVRAQADEATIQAAGTVLVTLLRGQADRGAGHLPIPPGCALSATAAHTGATTEANPPIWSWQAAFGRAEQELRDEYEACDSGRLQYYGAPEDPAAAAEICAMIAGRAAARDWLHGHLGPDARDGRPVAEALRLAAEQVAYTAAMRAAAAGARAAREPHDVPPPGWEAELLGQEPAAEPDLLTQQTTSQWTTRLYRAAADALTAVRPVPAEDGAQRVLDELLPRVAAAAVTVEDGRRLMEAGGNRRAAAIAAAVDSYGRGGRSQVARALGVEVLAVDRALQRARTAQSTLITRQGKPAAAVVSTALQPGAADLDIEDQEIIRKALSDAIAWVEAGHGNIMAAQVYRALLGRLIDQALGSGQR